ncbi:glutamate ABC transporter substrate-binding protein [Corynebacterium sp. CCUG 71335]|uniref:glutamate ABC transporter substrate-binding protein n=1 Tax=Corynebacterium sp. CCUG 71335 TaxID=2823892 RepID=UPI00210EAA44|nr:glutamate ABC transporter substrate-binding protein [Corynebacterium sp. CCUG 71335]MCQ4621239.1 glutamate ABC transporter substrate-binding protein [Corynebacterium sp. CCUG 71335]
MRSIHLAAALVSVLGVSGLSACGSPDDQDLLSQIESGRVDVGSAFTNPGLSMMRDDGSPAGLDIDIATYVINSIADDNGWDHPEIEWRETPPGQRASLLDNGYVDMVASNYSIDAKRAEEVSFAGPYLLTHQALLTVDGSHITGLESLDGKNLCFVTGTTAAKTLREDIPGVVLAEYDSYTACLDALRAGEVDALSTDAAILSGFSAHEPGVFQLVPLERDGAPLNDEHYGLGLPRDNDASVSAVNEALAKMHEDGSFDRFVDEHLASDAAVQADTPGDMSFLN